MVAREVVQIWRGLSPPGRFLAQDKSSGGDNGLWNDVGDKKAREKASQCLRERTPDVMPFVKQLEKQAKEAERLEKAKKEEAKNGGPSKVKSSSAADGKKADKKASEDGEGGDEHLRRTQKISNVPSSVLSSAAAGVDRQGGGGTPNSTAEMPPPPIRKKGRGSNDSGNSGGDVGNGGANEGANPAADGKKTKRRISRQEMGKAMPTAAKLLDDCFDDDISMRSSATARGAGAHVQAGGMSMEEYQNSLRDFLSGAPGEGGAEGLFVRRSGGRRRRRRRRRSRGRRGGQRRRRRHQEAGEPRGAHGNHVPHVVGQVLPEHRHHVHDVDGR